MHCYGARLAVGFFVLILACGGPKPSAKKGLGTSTDRPTGTSFALPQGVAVKGTIAGAASDTCVPAQTLGSGTVVNPCFTLQNSTGSTITLTFPSGLIFISSDLGVQNGLVINTVVVVLPPGPTTILVPLYCVNLTRHGSSATDLFQLGPVSDDPVLKEIITILSGKNLAGHEFDVQFAIWEYTDGDGLTDATRAKLKSL